MRKSEETNSDGHGNGHDTGLLSHRFVQMFAWVITIMWALSMILTAFIDDYEPHSSLHVLMMGLAGAAFGTNFINPKNKS
jgi:hypothetical protein